MFTVMRTVNYICASAPNHHFVALLEDADSKYGELVHHTNIRWLCQWVCFETIMRFVEWHLIIQENNGSNIEEINCEGQIDDVPFVVFVTGISNLNELKKGPQGKNKLNPEWCDKIKTFQSKVLTVLIPSKTA